MKNKWINGLMLLVLSAITLTSCVGCSGLGYYGQAVGGHLSLMNQREPIDQLLKDGNLSSRRQQQLEQAVQIRDFASRELALPDNGSYREFVELGRKAVVWNVVATPEFSLTPEEWCFPFAGCVRYRGYYSQQDAKDFAASLDDQNYDIYVSGSGAYSTLGWFDDPLLSTMVDRGKLRMAEVIFHELAHQQLYVKNDSTFNEAFASTVGEYGVRKWASTYAPEGLEKYDKALARKADFIALLNKTSKKLKALYATDQSAILMRQSKQEIFNTMRLDYAMLKQSWNGYTGYDRWFARPLNNARLASIATYRDRVPDFARWLKQCGSDFPRFYDQMAELAKLPKKARLLRLKGPAECETGRI